MTRTPAPALSEAEAARVAAFDAAPTPPEVVVETMRQLLAALVEAVGRGDEVGLPEAYRAARAALASPAPAPQGEEPTCYCGRLGHRLGGPILHKRTEECSR